MFEIMDAQIQGALIKVIGVGGCGGNAINHMIEQEVQGVQFVAINTDAQALRGNKAVTQLQIGKTLTKGLGAGAKPEVGHAAALEDRERIAEILVGVDMVFITAGMGGGTGTGAAPVVAQVAKELGILVVAVVTKPFEHERKRMQLAQAGIEALTEFVDSLIIVPNEKLMTVLGEDTTLIDAYRASNGVLQGAVAGIAEVINVDGIVNVDFADVKTLMSEKWHGNDGIGNCIRHRQSAKISQERDVQPLAGRCGFVGGSWRAGQYHSQRKLHHARIQGCNGLRAQCGSG